MTEILEKSGNFLRRKKWEPCHSITLILINIRVSSKLERDLFLFIYLFVALSEAGLRVEHIVPTACVFILTDRGHSPSF